MNLSNFCQPLFTSHSFVTLYKLNHKVRCSFSKAELLKIVKCVYDKILRSSSFQKKEKRQINYSKSSRHIKNIPCGHWHSNKRTRVQHKIPPWRGLHAHFELAWLFSIGNKSILTFNTWFHDVNVLFYPSLKQNYTFFSKYNIKHIFVTFCIMCQKHTY